MHPIQSPTERTTMNIEEKLAIHEMIAQYAYTYDSQDVEGFAQLFVEDGVFEVFVPGQSVALVRLQSRTAIRESAAKRLRQRCGRCTSRHYQSGILFDDLTSDTALTRTMVLVTHQGVTEAGPPPTLSGVYHDQWRKTPTGWRLAHRAARVDQDSGLSSFVFLCLPLSSLSALVIFPQPEVPYRLKDLKKMPMGTWCTASPGRGRTVPPASNWRRWNSWRSLRRLCPCHESTWCAMAGCSRPIVSFEKRLFPHCTSRVRMRMKRRREHLIDIGLGD